jgi:hypothetical protein
LLHALGESTHPVAGPLAQPDPLEGLLDGVVPGGLRDAPESCVEPEDLAPVEPGLIPEELGQVADAGTGGSVPERGAQDGAGTESRSDEAEEELDGGGLAGAVRAEQTEELASADLEVEAVQRRRPAEALDHVPELDRGGFDRR